MARILVIEDEELIRESLEDLLSLEGFEVITASNGEEGMNLAIQSQPDLILCDVMMPSLSGYDVLSQIRQNRTLNHVPFLFLTSIVNRHSNRKGMALGADDYLEKPCTKDELLEAIAVRLHKQKEIEAKTEQKMATLRHNIAFSLPHELNTPLAGIMGLSELMMLESDSLLPSEIYEYAKGINQSSERLHRLIQNYLLYTRLTIMRSQGKTKLAISYPCNNRMILHSLGERKEKQSDRAGDLQLDFVDVEPAISSDDFTTIAKELIDNAFKYSLKGSQVLISSEIVGEEWLLKIQDHGRGMDELQIANIGAFMQFDREFHEQQGVGLGLCLAHNLASFYGGKVSIHSQKDLGTTIFVSFPINTDRQ